MRLFFSCCVCFSSVCFVASGCGDSGNKLATDSGEMTVEEYKEIQAREDGKISEAQQNVKN